MTRGSRLLVFSRAALDHELPQPETSIFEELKQSAKATALQVDFITDWVPSRATADLDNACNCRICDAKASSYLPGIAAAYSFVTARHPAVIVACEALTPIVAARLSGVPSILLIRSLPAASTLLWESAAWADVVILGQRPGLTVVRALRKVVFVGPMVCDTHSTRADRESVRSRLSIPPSRFVLFAATEGEPCAHIASSIIPAFMRLKRQEKHLYWWAGAEAAELRGQLIGLRQVTIEPRFTSLDEMIAAANVVITNSARIAWEAAARDVPCISLIATANGGDPGFGNDCPLQYDNISLNADATDEIHLSRHIEALGTLHSVHVSPRRAPVHPSKISRLLMSEIQRLLRTAV